MGFAFILALGFFFFPPSVLLLFLIFYSLPVRFSFLYLLNFFIKYASSLARSQDHYECTAQATMLKYVQGTRPWSAQIEARPFDFFERGPFASVTFLR